MPDRGVLAECVINISEGRNRSVVDVAREAAGSAVLDTHSDPEHNRTVLTLGGPLDSVEEASRRVVAAAVDRIDLRSHSGVHPRFGAVDVVPFVALAGSVGAASVSPEVVVARDRLAGWAGTDLQLPCFLYGPERSLPEVRRSAFRSIQPDTGPRSPHPTAGASAVGARPILVAYNLWISGSSDRDRPAERLSVESVAHSLAGRLRSPTVRSLGFATEAGAQVSFNLIDPESTRLVDIYDAVASGVEAEGYSVLRAELVGLIPDSVLSATPRHRWTELDVGEDRTIEGRMAAVGYPLGDC